MEVLVVTGREERAKEHYYGEGGVPILSFHIPNDDDVMVMIMMAMRRRSFILLRTVHLMVSSNDLRSLAANLLRLTNPPFKDMATSRQCWVRYSLVVVN